MESEAAMTIQIENLSFEDALDKTVMTGISGGRLPQCFGLLIAYAHQYTMGACSHDNAPPICDYPDL
jgi:hypothetical protein